MIDMHTERLYQHRCLDSAALISFSLFLSGLITGSYSLSISPWRSRLQLPCALQLENTDYLQRIALLKQSLHCAYRSSTSISSSASFFENYDIRCDQITSESYSFEDDNHLSSLKDQHFEYLRRQHFDDAFNCIADMVKALNMDNEISLPKGKRLYWSRVVDNLIHAFTSSVFSPPYDLYDYETQHKVLLGIRAVNLQLSSSRNKPSGNLAYPYNTVSKRTLVNALTALTSLTSKPENNDNIICDSPHKLPDEAFRVLQRLVTGVGVRQSHVSLPNRKYSRNESVASVSVSNCIDEYQFNRVLSSFANVRRMDMVHRVLALQERTPHAPPLSPISYTILFNGCGRMRLLNDLDVALDNAIQHNIQPDTILMNSLVNAYVNCDNLLKAASIFKSMQSKLSNDGILTLTSAIDSDLVTRIGKWFEGFDCPQPNRRTYNIMLKGFANLGLLEDTIKLAEEMKQLRLWDAVTTNTVVHAYVKAGSLSRAEQVLSNFTVTSWNYEQKPQHPNIEAYTELVNAHSKGKNLTKAIAIYELMLQRGVKANEVTYNSLLNGFGRCHKINQAQKMLTFMKSKGFRISTTSFNSILSGLVETINTVESNISVDEFNSRVDRAMVLVREMISSGMRPNEVTVTVLVDALGRCNPPRVNEAFALVEKCESMHFVQTGNSKVLTALVNAFGKAGDFEGATNAFTKIIRLDTIAINSYMDCCHRCGKDRTAFQLFETFSKSRNKLVPNVVSYSIIIDVILRQPNPNSVKVAHLKYDEMKESWNIHPDKVLVDIILKAMLRRRNQGSKLDKNSMLVVSSVLRDAEQLMWSEGQLELRKRAFRDQLRVLCRTESSESNKEMDNLFQRKGWNKVDSGFRLWGGGRQERSVQNSKSQKCDFLETHGWNNVDSGFRFF